MYKIKDGMFTKFTDKDNYRWRVKIKPIECNIFDESLLSFLTIHIHDDDDDDNRLSYLKQYLHYIIPQLYNRHFVDMRMYDGSMCQEYCFGPTDIWEFRPR